MLIFDKDKEQGPNLATYRVKWNDDYREKWAKKLDGYLKDGFIKHTEASFSDDKVLIKTEGNPGGGIDSQYFDELVRKVILEE